MILFNEKQQKFYDTLLQINALSDINHIFWERVSNMDVSLYPISAMVLGGENSKHFQFGTDIVEGGDWVKVEVDYEKLSYSIGLLNTGCYLKSDLTQLNSPRPSQFHTWSEAEQKWVFNDTVENITNQLRPLTRRQFKLALATMGLDDVIVEALESIPDELTRKLMKIEYEEATTFERLSPSVTQMCQIVDLSEEEINEFWITALAL